MVSKNLIQNCVRDCNACKLHCLSMKENSHHQNCIRLCKICGLVCELMLTIDSLNHSHTRIVKQLMKSCCHECYNECTTHKHMKECQDCANSCLKCYKACCNNKSTKKRKQKSKKSKK